MQAEPKVFGIGFQKTGTTTLKWALYALGYDVKGGGLELIEPLTRGDLEPVYDVADTFDAFEDHPWPQLFKEMDARYPGSKFVLTLRDEASWIESVVNHLGFLPDPMQKLTYGVGFPAGFEDVFLDRYRRHNADVQDYFRDRPDDLLVLDFWQEAGWDTLCRFLGKPVPEQAFPHLNKGSYATGKRWVQAVAGRMVRAVRR